MVRAAAVVRRCRRRPQVVHNGMIATVDHPTAGSLRLVGIPVGFDEPIRERVVGRP